jgi:tetratricopeptide (TPR) repeat protein
MSTIQKCRFSAEFLGDLKKAMDYYKKASEISRDLDDLRGEASVFLNIGNVYHENRQPEEANTFYQRALVLFREVNDLSGEAKILGSLGNNALSVMEFLQAKNYYEQALEIHRQLNEVDLQAADLMNIGLIFASTKNLSAAINIFNEALELSRKTQNEGIEISILLSLGSAYSQSGNNEEAIRLLTAALNRAKESKQHHQIGTAYWDLGNAYAEAGKLQQAIDFMEQSLLYIEDGNEDIVLAISERINALKRQSGYSLDSKNNDLSLDKFIHEAILSVKMRNPFAEKYYSIASRMAIDSDSPLEIQELGVVLQSILIGTKKPDLSKLPNELAQYIRKELES